MKKQVHKLNIRYREMQTHDEGKGYVLTFSILIAGILLFMAWKLFASLH